MGVVKAATAEEAMSVAMEKHPGLYLAVRELNDDEAICPDCDGEGVISDNNGPVEQCNTCKSGGVVPAKGEK
jgi:hypothetical protein